MQNSDNGKIEILAPAGSMDALICAVNNGADAVYLGLRDFNARSKANNFTEEELRQAVAFSHFFGVKIYVAFNIIYKPNEYDAVLACMQKCRQMGVDAFILQDFAIIPLIKSIMPDMVLHLSTQAGVHNAAGASAAEKMGFSRVILSRETLLEDIKEIRKCTGLEIEFFVQGALCVSFSGNCYFSSLVSGYSGNRGKCMQLCRKKYTYKNKTAFWLSPKDICLADEVKLLVDAGVTSFKIEGRMRRAEYAGEAVNCYRNASEGNRYDKSRLKRLFNRGDYTDLYLKDPLGDVMYPAAQNHIGEKIGRVLSVSKNFVSLSVPLKKGDGVKFMRGTLETGNASVSKDGTVTSFSGKVKAGDDVRITTDKVLNNEILSRKRYVDFDLSALVENNAAVFILRSGKSEVTLKISDLPSAQSRPMSKNDIVECFSKTEDFALKLNNLDITIKDSVFVAKSELNTVRREACSLLRDKIIADYSCDKNLKVYNDYFAELNYFTSSERCIIMQTDSADIASVCSAFCDYIAYSPRDWTSTESILADLKKFKKPFLLSLPNVIRGEDSDYIKKCLNAAIVENVIVNNLGGAELAKNKKILCGPMLNIINGDFAGSKILSPEAKNRSGDNFVYYYGKFPVMTFCHCPLKTYYGRCLHCKNCRTDKIADEYGNEFPLYSYRMKYCYTHLLNFNPINLTAVNVKTQKKFVDLIGCTKDMCYNVMEKIYRGEKIDGGTLAFYNKDLN